MNEIDSRKIFNLYGIGESKQLGFHDTSRGNDDSRYVYIVEYLNKTKIAIKVTKNSFTTPSRVIGWANLCEHYNNMNIYCPRIIKNNKNEIYAELDGYIVYAEEFMKYKIANENAKVGECDIYQKRMYESLGIIAANPSLIVPWNTAFSIYDKFEESDLYDESYENIINLVKCYKENAPKYLSRIDALFNEFKHKRNAFEAEYRTLPKAVFQGDLNPSNILISENGEFKGLIDFNLSGTDTILNYIFCECCCYLKDEDSINTLLNKDSLKSYDEETSLRLSYVKKYYKFTDAEKNAFNRYYNIAMPFRSPYQCFFIKLIRNEGNKYAEIILDWIEYQMTRKDVDYL